MRRNRRVKVTYLLDKTEKLEFRRMEVRGWTSDANSYVTSDVRIGLVIISSLYF